MRLSGVIITLPYPAKPCWPNARSRSHWPKTNAMAAAKRAAWATALEARLDMPAGEQFTVQITCLPKPRGVAPDGDNINAAAKAYIDGIAAAMGVNDRCFTVLPPTIGNERASKFVIEVKALAN